MSEKQFKLSSETVLQYQIMDNDHDLNESEVVDLLNKLYEENEQLKKEYKIAINEMVTDYKKLEKENEQLREKNKQIGYLKRDLFILINLIRDTPMEFNCDFEKIVERWE